MAAVFVILACGTAEARVRHRPSESQPRMLHGVASVYSASFSGRKMANGERFNPASDNAASPTLPLGTVARVRRLDTGASTIVRFKDRQPSWTHRVADFSPHTMRQLGMEKPGLIKVAIEILSVPGV